MVSNVMVIILFININNTVLVRFLVSRFFIGIFSIARVLLNQSKARSLSLRPFPLYRHYFIQQIQISFSHFFVTKMFIYVPNGNNNACLKFDRNFGWPPRFVVIPLHFRNQTRDFTGVSSWVNSNNQLVTS